MRKPEGHEYIRQSHRLSVASRHTAAAASAAVEVHILLSGGSADTFTAVVRQAVGGGSLWQGLTVAALKAVL
jgi:hypothetical protein